MQSGKSDKNDISSNEQNTKSGLPDGVVLTFGVFDGVHVAHQIVIKRVVDKAAALNTDGIVISFDPHPAFSILGKAPPVLTTARKKVELLKDLGIDRIVLEDFNEQYSQLSPREFVKDILIGRFHAREIIVGYDCAFGKGRAGDKQILRKLGAEYGFEVDIVGPHRICGNVVSSTRIRAAISNGELDLSRKLLGRMYSVSGPVVPGKGMGREIGYPTANLQIYNQALPPAGVYAVEVKLDDRRHYGLVNMGVQPTLGKNEFRVEVHLLDFEGDLYDQEIEVSFVKKVRDEKTFANLEALAVQIREDESAARMILGDK